MKKCVLIVLVLAVLIGFVACAGKGNSPSVAEAKGDGKSPNDFEMDLEIDLNRVAKEDLGAMMPKILFVDAKNDRIGFWGTFGLFVINLEDASFHRTFNISALGLNQMGGEEITRFLISDDYNKIYMFNEGEDGNNVEDSYYYYNVEEDVLRVIPVGTGVEVLPPIPVFALEFVGGEQEGYTSGGAYVSEAEMVYLQSMDWKVKDLTLCKFDNKTQTTERIPIFSGRKQSAI